MKHSAVLSPARRVLCLLLCFAAFLSLAGCGTRQDPFARFRRGFCVVGRWEFEGQTASGSIAFAPVEAGGARFTLTVTEPEILCGAVFTLENGVTRAAFAGIDHTFAGNVSVVAALFTLLTPPDTGTIGKTADGAYCWMTPLGTVLWRLENGCPVSAALTGDRPLTFVVERFLPQTPGTSAHAEATP